MPFRIHAFIVLVFIGCLAAGDGPSSQAKDFSVFKEVMLAKEGRADLHISPSTFQRALSMAEKNFSHPHTLLEQYKIYALTLSVLQCGHTQIHPNKEVFREWLKERNSLPIDFYLVGKRLMVNKLLPLDITEMNAEKNRSLKKKNVPEGSEILSIDHRTIPEMMQEMGLFMSSDENGIDFKYFQATHLFDFYRHLAIPFDKDSIHVQYVHKKDTNEVYLLVGRAPVHTMNARLEKAAKLFAEEEENIGEFKIYQRCGYFRFYSFKASYGKQYETFLEDAFRKLKTKKVKRLIIDLRGNTGGAMQYSIMRYFLGKDAYLGRYVIEKPKHGIESSHLKKLHPDYVKHRRASRSQRRLIRKGKFDEGKVTTAAVDTSLIYHGAIVVITDEGTFSSAGILACHLKTLCNAKIVGRTAGGSFYAGNAGTLTLQLPKSKLKLFVNPNTFYSHLPAADDPFAIKQPDIELSPSITDSRKLDDYYFKAAKNAFK